MEGCRGSSVWQSTSLLSEARAGLRLGRGICRALHCLLCQGSPASAQLNQPFLPAKFPWLPRRASSLTPAGLTPSLGPPLHQGGDVGLKRRSSHRPLRAGAHAGVRSCSMLLAANRNLVGMCTSPKPAHSWDLLSRHGEEIMAHSDHSRTMVTPLKGAG